MRHNSLVSLITKLLVSAGCRDVVTEPLLLPTAGVTLPPGLTPPTMLVLMSVLGVFGILSREHS